MKPFLLALQFLTILPVKFKSLVKEEDFRSIFIFFPIVGAGIGLLLCSLLFLLRGIMPHLAVVAVILAAYTVLTGALHLDGLADSCDGLFAGKTKERILEIMQDSRNGAYAAVGVSLDLILKFAFLVSLPPGLLWRMLILMPMFSRWVQGLACAQMPYARDKGKSNYFFKAASNRDVLIGAVFTLGVFLFLGGLRGLALFLAALLPVGLFIKWVEHRINGMTGDTVGATNEVAEISLLFFSFFI
jgi:adenosylcobinamide-GDP ribazoletransferase